MAFQQAQVDGVCLRYPEILATLPSITHEMAVQFLGRSMQLAQTTPFQWGYIDRPADGQIFLIFIPPQLSLPNDGIRWPEPESRYTIPLGNGRELEMAEAKFGWVPQHEAIASRVRRRYRFAKGGHPQLILIHYSRGQSINVNPALNQPVRSYPVRPYNEPAVFVLGDRHGQKVYPGGAPPDRGASIPPGMAIPFGNPQAMLAQQSSSMEALERRGGRERDRSGSMATRPNQQQPQQRVEEEEDDESESISVRTIAMTRYRRNHEIMNEVFIHAAFGKQLDSRPTPPGYTIFKPDDIANQVSKLEKEVAELQAKAVQRQLEREAREREEISAITFSEDSMVM